MRNLDFIITRSTPKYLIRNFDFDFNKIFYDGDFVNAYNWIAIHNKSAYNNDFRSKSPYEIVNYITHIKRITKYAKRGFSILMNPEKYCKSYIHPNKKNQSEINDF